jgi:hypothetical protein
VRRQDRERNRKLISLVGLLIVAAVIVSMVLSAVFVPPR